MLAPFDWKHPDYGPIFAHRLAVYRDIKDDVVARLQLKAWYKDHPADFINDWGVTFDPRLAAKGVPTVVPFLLFDKQRDWVDWFLERWAMNEPGLTEKSRDMGVSWLAVATCSTLANFREGLTFGFGSRKEEYVDKIGSPKCLFWKARQFMTYLPAEFTGGWDAKRDSAHMRLSFPLTGSTITGEAGDNIGRGDRASAYLVDEEAYLERPQLVEAALSQTTDCRIGISSANGMGNPFAEKRHSGRIPVFTFHWRSDPRKDDAWYAKQCELLDPVTVAQEIDINYSASVEGLVMPSDWLQACVDAHIKLGFEPTGAKKLAFDVADEGRDKNATAGIHGVVLLALDEWSGKGGDIAGSTQKAMGNADDLGTDDLHYDADGLGADVKGAARLLNDKRTEENRPTVTVTAFRGSNKVFAPKSEDVPGRSNEDFFMNRKAQSWWDLRRRAFKTWRAVVFGDPYPHDELMSFDSAALNAPKPGAPYGIMGRMLVELAQPTYKKNEAGKLVINKTPEGMKSPNLADAVMIVFSRAYRAPMAVREDELEEI